MRSFLAASFLLLIIGFQWYSLNSLWVVCLIFYLYVIFLWTQQLVSVFYSSNVVPRCICTGMLFSCEFESLPEVRHGRIFRKNPKPRCCKTTSYCKSMSVESSHLKLDWSRNRTWMHLVWSVLAVIVKLQRRLNLFRTLVWTIWYIFDTFTPWGVERAAPVYMYETF